MPRHNQRRNNKPNHHRPQRSEKPRYEYTVGDTVYFHARPSTSSEEIYFMCRGIVLRQPTETSKVYKVGVAAVNPQTILHGAHPDLAKQLLNKRIPRDRTQLLEEPTGGLLGAIYTKTKWLEISEQDSKKFGRYCHEKTR